MTKALIREIECTVNAPEFAALARSWSCLRHRRGIDDADQPTSARLWRHPSEEALDEDAKPIATLTQPIKQRHATEIGKTNRSSPCRCRSEPSFTQTIGQHQPKQRYRIGNFPPPHECFRLACAELKLRGSAKPRNHHRPVFVYKRFTSHPLLESRTIPTRKHKLNAYAAHPAPSVLRGRSIGKNSGECSRENADLCLSLVIAMTRYV